MKEKIVKNAAAAVLSAAVLSLAAAAAILYQRGVYDISFIERPGRETSVPGVSGSDEPESDSGGSASDPGESGGDGPAETVDENGYAAFVSEISDAGQLRAEGYTVSEAVYNGSSFKLGMVTPALPLPFAYSNRNTGNAFQPNYVPAIRTYMGYLLFDTGDCMYAMDGSGAIVAEGIDGLTPINQRDKFGHPLFVSGGNFYYINEDGSNTLSQVDYSTAFGTARLSFAYPKSYIQTSVRLKRYYVDTQQVRLFDIEKDTDITDFVERVVAVLGEEGLSERKIPEYEERLCDVRLWGYTNESGDVVIEAQYFSATEFNSDGYAFVSRHDGRVIMINQNGDTVLDPFGRSFILPGEDIKYVVDGCYLPKSFGSESIGMFRFDHGLMRVYKKYYNYYELDELIDTESTLIYRSGEEFAIPAGYTLSGYSDGVLLLKGSDSRYGYMDYTGRWIVQPIYSYARPFFEGLAVVGSGQARFVVDTEGNVVIPPVFEVITDCSGGMIAAYNREHGWTVYSKMELTAAAE